MEQSELKLHGPSLVARWIGMRLPTQEQTLVREDPTRRRATEPGAAIPEPKCLELRAPRPEEPARVIQGKPHAATETQCSQSEFKIQFFKE